MEKKTIKKVVAGCLALVCMATAGIAAVATNGFGYKTTDKNVEAGVNADMDGTYEAEGYKGIRLMNTVIAAADYEEYGISPLAETAQLLTATVNPGYATNKNVEWSVAWKNPSSTWAKSKSVTDYVTVVPTSAGAATATVSCLKAFSEQVIVTVASESDPEVTATATVDYAKRLTDAYMNFGGSNEVTVSYGGWGVNIALDDDFTVADVENKRAFSDGTIDDEFAFSAVVTVNESILAQASTTTGYTYTAKPGIDFANQTASFADLIYFDNKPVAGSALEALNDYLYNNPLLELFQVEVTYTGQYSTFSNDISFYVMEDALFISVTDIRLDQGSLIF